jgi:septal ring factor EnvC (AmiA/AmiB activator)
MKKLWKYIVGFFTILGGILIAFLSGKGAGRKEEKIKGLKKDSKIISNRIKDKSKKQKKIKKSITKKDKEISNLKKQKDNIKVKDLGTKDAKDFLKKYTKSKK